METYLIKKSEMEKELRELQYVHDQLSGSIDEKTIRKLNKLLGFSIENLNKILKQDLIKEENI